MASLAEVPISLRELFTTADPDYFLFVREVINQTVAARENAIKNAH